MSAVGAVAARQRADEALRLRTEAKTYREIADALGFVNPGSAYHAVKSALDRQPYEDAKRIRVIEVAKLDALEQVARRQMAVDHLMVSHGRVVTMEVEGEKVPVIDHGLKMQALDRLLKIAERRAKLLGLDAPTRHVVEVIDGPTVDAAIAQLTAEMAALAGSEPIPSE